MLRRLFVLAALSLACVSAQAGDLAAGPFKVAESKILNVAFKGKPLVSGDSASYLPDLTVAEKLVTGQSEQATTLNLIRKDSDKLQLRREVALFKDGHMELTVRMRLFPYSNDPERTSFNYEFRVPAEALDNATYKAVRDRVFRIKRIEGTLRADQKNGMIISQCRFLALQTKYGDFVMDFDPYGVIAMGDYMKYGGPTGVWNVIKSGSDFVFAFGMTARAHGSIATGKMLLYEGPFDYDVKHPHQKWQYNGPTPAMYQYTFGTTADIEGFVKADTLAYDRDRGFGWLNGKGLKRIQSDAPDIIANCVVSESADEFRMDVTPGYYVATVRIGCNGQAVGPVTIAMNGEAKARDVRVAADDTKTLIFSGHVSAKDGQLRLQFSGAPWAVRSLVVHPVIYDNEDFTFSRGLWVADGLFTPNLRIH